MDEIDIPEAIRNDLESAKSSRRSARFLPLIIGVILCLGVGGILLMLVFSSINKSTEKSVSSPTVEPVDPQPVKPKPESVANKPAVNKSTQAKPSSEKPENLLGHLPYDVAPESELETITADGRLKMRSPAAQKFQQMQAAAQEDGINLIPISAFRTTKDQEQLFFGVKEQRAENTTKRAEVSAPPGYSEHHTGYAVDIGDGNAPATNLEPQFADTAAFRWLQENAPKYSFELSFPPNNEQGVNYEPWHWRFVGDRQSLETFYKARN
ncbi:MAG: M15 family metallopeptidase [Waterburya sp.]